MRLLPLFLAAQENVLLGGQAVLEGVMMRSPQAFAVAVRRPDGEIVYLSERAPSWSARRRLLRLPFLRGVSTLFQSLGIGLRALNFSAEQALPEEQAGASSAKTGAALWISVLGALLVGVALFFALPLALTEGLKRLFPGIGGGVAYNRIDGALRGVFFLAYIAAIRMVKDIGRLFRYHGAEHKVVHAFEAKVPLDVEHAQGFSVLHPRCGTSFLLFVMVVSILVFCCVPSAWPAWGKGLARLALLPLVVGLSYELLRFSARRGGAAGRALVAPGLWLQRLTTGEPDDGMVQVALAAFHRAAELEGGAASVVL